MINANDYTEEYFYKYVHKFNITCYNLVYHCFVEFNQTLEDSCKQAGIPCTKEGLCKYVGDVFSKIKGAEIIHHIEFNNVCTGIIQNARTFDNINELVQYWLTEFERKIQDNIYMGDVDEYIRTKTNIPWNVLWNKLCDIDMIRIYEHKFTTYEEYLKWEQNVNTPRFKTDPRYVPPQRTYFPMELIIKDGKIVGLRDLMPFGATN